MFTALSLLLSARFLNTVPTTAGGGAGTDAGSGGLSTALLSLAFRSPSRMITSVWDHSSSAAAQREGVPRSRWPLQSSPTFFFQGHFVSVFFPLRFCSAGLLYHSGVILLMGSDLMALHILSKLNTAARKIQ